MESWTKEGLVEKAGGVEVSYGVPEQISASGKGKGTHSATLRDYVETVMADAAGAAAGTSGAKSGAESGPRASAQRSRASVHDGMYLFDRQVLEHVGELLAPDFPYPPPIDQAFQVSDGGNASKDVCALALGASRSGLGYHQHRGPAVRRGSPPAQTPHALHSPAWPSRSHALHSSTCHKRTLPIPSSTGSCSG